METYCRDHDSDGIGLSLDRPAAAVSKNGHKARTKMPTTATGAMNGSQEECPAGMAAASNATQPKSSAVRI
ncbi:hypothetical protein OKHIF_03650 [Mycobacteroides chelonae]